MRRKNLKTQNETIMSSISPDTRHQFRFLKRKKNLPQSKQPLVITRIKFPSNNESKQFSLKNIYVPQIRREYAIINEELIPQMFQKKIFIENPELEDPKTGF